MRMDYLTLAGLALGLFAIVGGNAIKGSDLGALWHLSAFIIVIVGTFGAVMIQTPMVVFKRAFVILPWLFSPPSHQPSVVVRRVVSWSNTARKQGLLGLEDIGAREREPLARKGLQLLADGNEPENLRAILEVEVDTREEHDMQAAKVFESMGVYAPTLGIVGAVLGLISVMRNLDDPSALGPGIAVAFIATIYGIASANLLFLPMASKLKSVIAEESRQQQMLIEGLVCIAEGDNPRNIEMRLKGHYLEG